jgi:hypothetical protein
MDFTHLFPEYFLFNRIFRRINAIMSHFEVSDNVKHSHYVCSAKRREVFAGDPI